MLLIVFQALMIHTILLNKRAQTDMKHPAIDSHEQLFESFLRNKSINDKDDESTGSKAKHRQRE